MNELRLTKHDRMFSYLETSEGKLFKVVEAQFAVRDIIVELNCRSAGNTRAD
jgi:hypothetical protein